jgi:N-formylglutamate amidohydrolase
MPLHSLILVLLLPLALILDLSARPDSPSPADLVSVQKGSLPIIVSVPHGGTREVPDVPERQGRGIANFFTVRDANTIEIAEAFSESLEKKLGGKPWMVVALFDRKYVDANRPPDGAYEADRAKPYYDAYHAALAAACKAIQKKHRGGILLDIHGQGEYPDFLCRGTRNGETVKLLRERRGWDAVAGADSILGRMEKAGYKILPRCDAGESAKEEPAFAGSHIVESYGSHTGYGIDAIQLEFGTSHRLRKAYPKTAADLAAAVAAFHEAYLQGRKR